SQRTAAMMRPWRCRRGSRSCSGCGIRSCRRRWADRLAARWQRPSLAAAAWGCSAPATGAGRGWARRGGCSPPGTTQPGGIGFLTWAIDAAAVERALAYGPRAIMLSFGDPSPFVARIRQADPVLIIQVTDLDEARQAVDLGADVIVAQGTEAGGHGAR